MSHTLFIADLHLSPTRQDITDCFERFMKQEAINADALYVLGDLFEVWIGDDDNSPFHRQIKAAFSAVTEQGVPVYFIHGNRDFLIGQRFSRETGVTLLSELECIDLYGTPTLILHGDTLCLEDVDYQAFRRKVHQRWLQRLFLSLPLTWRRKIAAKMRAGSANANQQKSTSIMDVTPQEVQRQLDNANVRHMIHGHTHRPHIHQWHQHGTAYRRIVLGDWYQHGSVLVCNEQDCDLQTRDFTHF
ncbi:UDP-2,3-diacylglucosamine diphosphatase [Salinivibrio sp. IB868]|uniref:UDP-2,3-diacylglucosamine diphosphatase n=1 Tax=unclassified Salinivibrio TaxID=2636825 RepID=UPI000984E4C0|nr:MULTISPECIES: UDP-2,3-diacylglucosamine diphosphatase [unclassified Salinivibrio]OOE68926.1 UDP-2,3-diacylglucosamine diphosphatase [Salinivibrio sp. IB868]OOE77791.1 UDP-2,3-diacylglucosamine diphosphatase [Salinivibrio sp. IB870]